jgi:hypothetical protein
MKDKDSFLSQSKKEDKVLIINVMNTIFLLNKKLITMTLIKRRHKIQKILIIRSAITLKTILKRERKAKQQIKSRISNKISTKATIILRK